MPRCSVRRFFTGLLSSRHFLSTLYARLHSELLRPTKWQAGSYSSLFALVVLLMLSGTMMGWQGRNILATSIMRNYLLQADVIFTPGPEHASPHTKVHNTADQVSTNFDPASGRLLISSSAPVHLTPQSLMFTATATTTINPGLLTSHMDTGSRLQIPALSVDAPIETVGTQANGNMDLPSLHIADGVGWYQKGPWPGQMGSAVIDGYVSHPDSSPAIFSRLGDLHAGDLVLIVNADGSEQHFYVASLNTYLANHVPLANIFKDTSGIYLNLITCNSAGASDEQQSTEPLIVHTVQN